MARSGMMMNRASASSPCSLLLLLLPLMGLSTAVATANQIHTDHLLIGVTKPTASCLDGEQEQIGVVEQDLDLQVERDLLVTGKRYNLPPLLPRQKSIPSSWIVNQHPNDDEAQDSTFVKIQDCISNAELDQILSMKSFLQADWIMDDRHEDTEYYHVVHRVEPLLKEKYLNLYETLISKMLTVDTDIWRITESVDRVYPEIEFIEYNQTAEGQAPKMGFGSHVDNGSMLTAVFMLSETAAYEGGSLNFAEHAGLSDEPGRPANFEIRDCAVFRGDRLSHWVTPITKGTRMVLQIELHSSFEDRGDDDEGEDEEDELKQELERTGKLYHLPLLSEREDASMDQAKWIVNRLDVDEPGKLSTFVKVPECLSLSQWDDLLSLESFLKPDLRMDDRDEEIEYYHVVHRVEPILKKNFSSSGLYETLIGKMLSVDNENWKVLGRVTAVYPEIEFIVYNQTLEGQPPKMGFGSHVDNGSVLTAVFMLSDVAEFEGGSLVFARDVSSDIGDAAERPANFAVRECAMFRGEWLSHWVTPVTRGTRKVLQIELHLSFEDRGDDDDEEGDEKIEVNEYDEEEDDEDYYDEEDFGESSEEDEDYYYDDDEDEWCDEGDESCFEEED
eukprot:scaffold522_cov168-Amphora_coffeaeformis.AAC.16